MNKKPRTIKNIVEYISKNKNCLAYCNYDYGIEYDCENNDCNTEGICRCGKLTNCKIESLDVSKLLDVCNKMSIVDQYCVDRVVTLNGIHDKNNWEISVCGGYYGEEIDGVDLDHSVFNSIISQLNGLDNKTDIEKIKLLLKYEYGYLLAVLKDKSFLEIISLSKNNIRAFNDEYNKKINKEEGELYKNYNFPRAVVRINNSGDYVIVDGYHRLASVAYDEKVDVFLLT